jgi:uncharacterized protein YndB with AHSA1/START domain
MTSSTDRIEKKIVLKAPRSRVWRAISNAEEFGDWFCVDFKGKTFVPGQPVQGNITYPGYEHLVCEMVIERMEPERLLSWRWHPAAIDVAVDYSNEPTTLVVFELSEVDSGTSSGTSSATLLSIVESGFDNIPVARRLDAFRMNSDGWEEQTRNVEKHVVTP